MVDYIRNEFVEEATAVIRAGKKGQPQSFTQGGAQATGSIAFADNPTAADTITLNSVWIEFSAAATDFTTAGTQLDPYILQIAVDLATTLTNLATALNGSANASLSVATYDGSSGTSLAITYDTNTTDGNLYTLAASADTPSGATLTGGQDTPALSLNTDSHTFTLTQAVDQDFTLASGSNFQEKTIILDAKGAGNAVLTANLAGAATTCTFNTANDFVILKYMGGEWQTVVNSGCTIA